MEDEIKFLESKIAGMEKHIEEQDRSIKDLEDDLEGANNDKKALYDLLIDLSDEIERDVKDRISEARESAKQYLK